MFEIGRTTTYPSSNVLFYNWYKSVRAYTPTLFTVMLWAAFDVVEAVLYKASSSKSNVVNGYVSASAVLSYLEGADMRTPFGRVAFDSTGVNTVARSIVGQKLPSSSTSEIVYPSDIQTASFVYPMPTWDERVYTWSLVGGNQKKLSVIIAATCSALLVVIMVTVYIHRKGKLTKYLVHQTL